MSQATSKPATLPTQAGAASTSLNSKTGVKTCQQSPAKLRIVLIGKDEKPVGGKAWDLVSPIHASGKTAPNGLIEVDNVKLENGSGTLRVDMGKPAKPAATAAAAPPAAAPDAAPPYPPPIKADDFKDKSKNPAGPAEDDGLVEWSLSLRLLKDMDNDAGIKDRLHSLGYSCDAASAPEVTIKAVKAYQWVHMKQKERSGQLGDVKANVQAWHDTL